MISVIIPAKDEPYLQTLVDGINREVRQGHEIIVVDKSAAAPRVRGARVLRQKSDGLGNAILEGLKRSGGDVIAVMDADGSHDPADLRRMLGKIPQYDIVLGSKLVRGGKTEDSYPRRVVTLFLGAIARTCLGVDVRDPMTGFMVIKRSVLKKIRLRPRGFKIVMEVLYKSKALNARVVEVPITFHKRKAGESKVGFNSKGLKEFSRIINLMVELRSGK